ncbi:Urease accessory protein UreG, partial [hydrothermal vent metagenome]
LADMVGASLEVMKTDSQRMRGDRPFVFTQLKTAEGLNVVMDFLVHEGMLSSRHKD